MKAILPVVVIVAGLSVGHVATAQTSRSEIARVAEAVKRKDLVPELEREIPRLMTEGEVPGLQFALVRGGKVDWIKSFGVKNAETGEAVTNDTIFEAASLSKPVFAYAVMKLVEAGRLDIWTSRCNRICEQYLKNDDRINRITARDGVRSNDRISERVATRPAAEDQLHPGREVQLLGRGNALPAARPGKDNRREV